MKENSAILKKINQFEPYITNREIRSVVRYLKSGGWLTEFEETQKFEQKIAEFIGVRHAVVVSNGTVALYLALSALGIGRGDEVIVPDYTMIATPNAVRWANAKVSLCDVDSSTLCMDLAQARVSKSTRALMYVSINGRSGDMGEITDYCRDHDIHLVEDACQAFGSKWNGKFLGTFGDVGTFSFTPHKIITTGQGGAVVTNNSEIDHRVRQLKDFCRTKPGEDIHNGIGFNFKFTDLQAVIGLQQLATIKQRMKKKKDIFTKYVKALEDSRDLTFLPTDLSNVVPWFVDVITAGSRDKLAARLKSRGIGSRPFYPPVHTQLPYKTQKGRFSVSSALARRGLWLPSSLKLRDRDIAAVARAIKSLYPSGSS